MTVFEKARAEGLIRPEYRGMSAKQMREADAKHAEKFAAFVDENRAELVAAVAGKLGA